MGLDYGERRIGVAISDPRCRIALPHEVIDRKRGGLEAALARIDELARTYEVDRIVVGLPIHMSGRSGPEATAARRFAEVVHERTRIEIALVDERWTTREAERARDAGSARGRRKRAPVDAAAAALILRTWLEGNPT